MYMYLNPAKFTSIYVFTKRQTITNSAFPGTLSLQHRSKLAGAQARLWSCCKAGAQAASYIARCGIFGFTAQIFGMTGYQMTVGQQMVAVGDLCFVIQFRN